MIIAHIATRPNCLIHDTILPDLIMMITAVIFEHENNAERIRFAKSFDVLSYLRDVIMCFYVLVDGENLRLNSLIYLTGKDMLHASYI